MHGALRARTRGRMASKFETFASLHVPGNPVVLYNIWDVGSALAVVRAGAKALATGSHPVADAHGWPDGQNVPIDFALANAKRIVDAVELPLTVDFESAYSADPEEGGRAARRSPEHGRLADRDDGDRPRRGRHGQRRRDRDRGERAARTSPHVRAGRRARRRRAPGAAGS